MLGSLSQIMSDTSWSYSSLSSALLCLKKYKYCYIDKIQPEGLESGDLIFGSALHHAVNASLLNQDANSIFELYWDSYKGKDVSYGRYDWRQLKELGKNFVRIYDKKHRPNYEFLFGEKRLFAVYKGVSLEGTPDFYGRYLGRTSLRDFKTSGYKYDSFKANCALQLNLYAYLLIANNLTTGIETLGYTVFNKGTGYLQDLTWEFSEKEMHKALDDLVSYVSLIEQKGHNYPRNLNSCLAYNRKCEYWDLCHKKETE